MNFRTISQLPEITNAYELGTTSVMEVSRALPVGEGEPQKYQSFKITSSKFGEFIKDLAISALYNESEFGNQHDQMWIWLQRIVADVPAGGSTFVISGDNLKFDKFPSIEGALTEFDLTDERIVNVDTMRNFMSVNSPMFINNDTEFSTSYFNVENNLMLDSNEPPYVNGEKHNSYIFRINNTRSNEWITTDSGIFTCYGWVDEAAEGEPDNARRWIALEGKLGEDDEGDAAWKILQLQPFIHNLYCSYVSFTFPVDKGLSLRLRTGFKVGTNSNKYQASQGSLTNHIANAFVGGIYHTKSLNSDFNRGMSNREMPIEKITTKATTATLKDKVNQIIDYLQL